MNRVVATPRKIYAVVAALGITTAILIAQPANAGVVAADVGGAGNPTAWADFDGDGLPDVALAAQAGVDRRHWPVALGVQYGSGVSETISSTKHSSDLLSSVVADFNGDGYDDLAAGLAVYRPDSGRPLVTWVWNGSANGLTFSTKILPGQYPNFAGLRMHDLSRELEAGDLDGDGDDELISYDDSAKTPQGCGATSLCWIDTGAIAVIPGNAHGLRPARARVTAGWVDGAGKTQVLCGWSCSLEIADVTGDGLADAILPGNVDLTLLPGSGRKKIGQLPGSQLDAYRVCTDLGGDPGTDGHFKGFGTAAVVQSSATGPAQIALLDPCFVDGQPASGTIAVATIQSAALSGIVPFVAFGAPIGQARVTDVDNDGAEDLAVRVGATVKLPDGSVEVVFGGPEGWPGSAIPGLRLQTVDAADAGVKSGWLIGVHENDGYGGLVALSEDLSLRFVPGSASGLDAQAGSTVSVSDFINPAYGDPVVREFISRH